MPFEQGREKTGGRTKGTKDTYTTDVREALAKISADYILGDGEARTLKADLAALRPIDRVTVMEKYLKYWLPTMGTLSVTGQSDGEPVNITVTYHSDAAKTDADDDSDLDYSEV